MTSVTSKSTVSFGTSYETSDIAKDTKFVKILNIIDKIGYKEPTPIQRQAIPIGLTNR